MHRVRVGRRRPAAREDSRPVRQVLLDGARERVPRLGLAVEALRRGAARLRLRERLLRLRGVGRLLALLRVHHGREDARPLRGRGGDGRRRVGARRGNIFSSFHPQDRALQPEAWHLRRRICSTTLIEDMSRW